MMNPFFQKRNLYKHKSAISLKKTSDEFINHLNNIDNKDRVSSSKNNNQNSNEIMPPLKARTFDLKRKTYIKPNENFLNRTNTNFAIKLPLNKNKTKNGHRFSCIINNIEKKQKMFYGSTYQEIVRKKKDFVKKAEKEIKDKDKLFKLFRESGLHYSLSYHKYFFGDQEEKFKKTNNVIYSMKRMLGDKDDEINDNTNEKILSANKNSKKKLQKNKSLPSIFYSTTEEDEEDKMKFNDYLQLQSKADVRLRPKLGETSYDLVNYIKKIEGIRKNIILDFMKEIKQMENRYNEEHPKIDAHVKTKLQGLYNHRWKNFFYLDDYQNLFLNNLRGKISTKNYNIMSKYFKQIQMMCFSKGPIKFSKIKSVQG